MLRLGLEYLLFAIVCLVVFLKNSNSNSIAYIDTSGIHYSFVCCEILHMVYE